MIQKQEEGGEKYLEVETGPGEDPKELIKNFREASGLVKRGELDHDTAVYRAARRESARLLEQGATIRRVRIDAEMKKQVARAAETARAREGKVAADAARWKAAEELGLPVEEGRGGRGQRDQMPWTVKRELRLSNRPA